MENFPLPQGAYKYRPLRKRTPELKGWDVYALQTALVASGFKLPEHGADGHFGTETHRKVRRAQEVFGLVVDGIAGVITQRSLAVSLLGKAEGAHDLPAKLMYGQLEHESSFWLGNHSAARENGSRDCGVAQRNSQYTPIIDGFHAGKSITALARNLRDRYRAYRELGVEERRAYELASGSWNAPAWTDKIARGEAKLTDYPTLAAYIASTTAYVDW